MILEYELHLSDQGFGSEARSFENVTKSGISKKILEPDDTLNEVF
jgi:hypothetical protein